MVVVLTAMLAKAGYPTETLAPRDSQRAWKC